MGDLENLIAFIQMKHGEINNEWEKSDKYVPLNMKKNKVENIYKDESLLSYVFNYRNFINDHAVELIGSIQNLKISCPVNSRVKALNSIQFKIENYEKNHEDGKVPIKKCLNDLFGIRMIFPEEISYNNINIFVKKKFPSLKCIDAERGNYKAVHIYFGNDDNKKFQWELQLWDKKYEKSNYESHAKYKQDYTKWESENI